VSDSSQNEKVCEEIKNLKLKMWDMSDSPAKDVVKKQIQSMEARPVEPEGANQAEPTVIMDESRIAELEMELAQTKKQLAMKAQIPDPDAPVDQETQDIMIMLETQILTLQQTTEDALQEIEYMRQNGVQGRAVGGGGATSPTSPTSPTTDVALASGKQAMSLDSQQLLQQMAVAKTKYQANVARLQVDRQALKEKLLDQKAMYAKQMEAIREGFVQALAEKDEIIHVERATAQAILRGNPAAMTCYYLSDDE